MPGWISDPIANPVGEAQGFANVASQPFQGQEWLAPEKWYGAMEQRSAAMLGTTDPGTGDIISGPEPFVPAAQLQQRYGVAPAFGVSGLTFDTDLPESVASAMRDAKLAEQRRADAAARTPDGIISGAERFGAGAVTQLLDPVGALSMMVPMGGEARGISMLARTGSALARGAAAGAAVTTPLVALHKLYADQFGEDYSAGDALRDILMGGALGGGLHASATLGGDLIGRAFQGSAAQRIVDADPDIRYAAASEAVSAALDERPPQSGNLIELTAAMKARASLQQFADYQSRLDDQSGEALQLGDQADAAKAAASAAAERLAGLQDEHQGFQADIADAQGRLDAATDPVTADRLAGIDSELAGVIPPARRTALIAERDMLTEGARATPAQDALEAARAQADLEGLQAGAARQSGLVDQARVAADQAATSAGATDRAFRVRAASVEGREALTQSLAERTLQRLAGTLKVDLSAEDARSLARSVLREGRNPADAVGDVIRRSDAGASQAAPALGDGGASVRLGAEARGAATDIASSMARRAGDGNMAPEDAAAIKAAGEAGARARAGQAGDTDGEIKDLHNFMQHAQAAGAMDNVSRAALEAIRTDGETAKSWINALPQAAACMLRGVL